MDWLSPASFPIFGHFNCVVNKKARIQCNLSRSVEQRLWTPILMRNLKEGEMDQYVSLLNLLSGVLVGKRG